MKRKTVIIFSLSFTAAFAVFLIVIFNHIAEEQIKKDRNFIDNEMKPAIIFVKDFYKKSAPFRHSFPYRRWAQAFYRKTSAFLSQL